MGCLAANIQKIPLRAKRVGSKLALSGIFDILRAKIIVLSIICCIFASDSIIECLHIKNYYFMKKTLLFFAMLLSVTVASAKDNKAVEMTTVETTCTTSEYEAQNDDKCQKKDEKKCDKKKCEQKKCEQKKCEQKKCEQKKCKDGKKADCCKKKAEKKEGACCKKK